MLMALLATLMPALMLFVLLRRPIRDVDIFWQLRLGEMALAQGHWITREPFAASPATDRLARPDSAGAGTALVGLGRAAPVRCAVLARCYERGCLDLPAAWRAGGGCIDRSGEIAFVLALPYASIRPQSLALLCFGLLLVLLRLQGSTIPPPMC
ncbi:MAG: hypothetical protein BGP16_10255 [Sphingobium sp. 66-54]|nr:MAG: hypothetical protein BGP16_10255 [Sphingobium sp. 66-54]